MKKKVVNRNIVKPDDTLRISCKYGSRLDSGFSSIAEAIDRMIYAELGQFKGQDMSDVEFFITNQTREWSGTYRLLKSGKAVKLP